MENNEIISDNMDKISLNRCKKAWSFFHKNFYRDKSKPPTENDFVSYLNHIKKNYSYSSLHALLSMVNFEYKRRFKGHTVKKFKEVRKILQQSENCNDTKTFTLDQILKFVRLDNNIPYFLVRKAVVVVSFCCGLLKCEAMELMMDDVEHDTDNQVFRIHFIRLGSTKPSKCTIYKEKALEFYEVLDKYLIALKKDLPDWKGSFFVNSRGHGSKFQGRTFAKVSMDTIPQFVAANIGLDRDLYNSNCWRSSAVKEKSRFVESHENIKFSEDYDLSNSSESDIESDDSTDDDTIDESMDITNASKTNNIQQNLYSQSNNLHSDNDNHQCKRRKIDYLSPESCKSDKGQNEDTFRSEIDQQPSFNKHHSENSVSDSGNNEDNNMNDVEQINSSNKAQNQIVSNKVDQNHSKKPIENNKNIEISDLDQQSSKDNNSSKQIHNQHNFSKEHSKNDTNNSQDTILSDVDQEKAKDNSSIKESTKVPDSDSKISQNNTNHMNNVDEQILEDDESKIKSNKKLHNNLQSSTNDVGHKEDTIIRNSDLVSLENDASKNEAQNKLKEIEQEPLKDNESMLEANKSDFEPFTNDTGYNKAQNKLSVVGQELSKDDNTLMEVNKSHSSVPKLSETDTGHNKDTYVSDDGQIPMEIDASNNATHEVDTGHSRDTIVSGDHQESTEIDASNITTQEKSSEIQEPSNNDFSNIETNLKYNNDAEPLNKDISQNGETHLSDDDQETPIDNNIDSNIINSEPCINDSDPSKDTNINDLNQDLTKESTSKTKSIQSDNEDADQQHSIDDGAIEEAHDNLNNQSEVVSQNLDKSLDNEENSNDISMEDANTKHSNDSFTKGAYNSIDTGHNKSDSNISKNLETENDVNESEDRSLSSRNTICRRDVCDTNDAGHSETNNSHNVDLDSSETHELLENQETSKTSHKDQNGLLLKNLLESDYQQSTDKQSSDITRDSQNLSLSNDQIIANDESDLQDFNEFDLEQDVSELTKKKYQRIWDTFYSSFYLDKTKPPNNDDFIRYAKHLGDSYSYATVSCCLTMLNCEYKRRYNGKNIRNIIGVRKILMESKEVSGKKITKDFTMEQIVKFVRIDINNPYYLVRKALVVISFCCRLKKHEAAELLMDNVKHDTVDKVFRIHIDKSFKIDNDSNGVYAIYRKYHPEFYDTIKSYLSSLTKVMPNWKGFFFLNPKGMDSKRFNETKIGIHTLHKIPLFVAEKIGLNPSEYTSSSWIPSNNEDNPFLEENVHFNETVAYDASTIDSSLSEYDSLEEDDEQNEQLSKSQSIKKSSIDYDQLDDLLLSWIHQCNLSGEQVTIAALKCRAKNIAERIPCLSNFQVTRAWLDNFMKKLNKPNLIKSNPRSTNILQEVENHLFSWMKEKTDNGMTVTLSDIKSTAAEIALEFNYASFIPSNTWLEKFMKKFRNLSTSNLQQKQLNNSRELELDKYLFKWIDEKSKLLPHKNLSNQAIKKASKKFAKQIGYLNFNPSQDWLNRFNLRLNERVIPNQGASMIEISNLSGNNSNSYENSMMVIDPLTIHNEDNNYGAMRKGKRSSKSKSKNVNYQRNTNNTANNIHAVNESIDNLLSFLNHTNNSEMKKFQNDIEEFKNIFTRKNSH